MKSLNMCVEFVATLITWCPHAAVWTFQDSQIKDILSTSPTTMTITIMPKFIYEHMIKRYGFFAQSLRFRSSGKLMVLGTVWQFVQCESLRHVILLENMMTCSSFALMLIDVTRCFQDVHWSPEVGHGPLCPRGVRTMRRTGNCLSLSLSVFIPIHLLCLNHHHRLFSPSHLKMPFIF